MKVVSAADSDANRICHRWLQGWVFRGIARLKFPETGSESLIILQ